ncbi:MAG: ATP-binding protein [Eggerthellaceae bacterium]|nr:ATP-binding protein [Eggerthellaceae bacterium]
MFIGRKRELEVFRKLYESKRFEFVVVYGRRRVGKTALINEFIGDKKAIYFTGIESNEKQNLENFSRCIFECISGVQADTSFVSFQAALEYVFEISIKERLILVIDEYPYVARAFKSLASTLQLLIDKYKESSRLMLVICGSSMSYMEDEILSYKAPLYGRHTAQLKVEPFEFGEACKFFENFSDEDKALLYGIVGGTPQYILQIDPAMSVEDNIKNTFLNPSSALFEEPENLLKQEVREPAIYNALITAVAGGASTMSEISKKSGEDTSVCSTYIRNLIALGIMKKETPYGEKASRKSLYSIADNMYRFWYRFVPQNSSAIARGGAEIVYKRIQPFFSEYMGKVFEGICAQYLWKKMINGELSVCFSGLGRWWGNNPVAKTQEEIDIMGEEDKDTALFAECKWTNEKVDVHVLEKLVTRSHLFSYANSHLILFSRHGFTKGCEERAEKMGNVSLVTYEEIYNYLISHS